MYVDVLVVKQVTVNLYFPLVTISLIQKDEL